jgi:hypothetical protein
LAGKIAVEPEREWTVLVFAGVVTILLVLAAFTADRTGYVDELGLYNPSYMLAHYGNLTYPVYGVFDNVIVIHPPVHVGVIGLFARLGFTWYYAEAMPAFLWFLLGIVMIVRGPFPAIMKLGLLFCIGFLLHGTGPATGFGFNIFGTRPEGHVQAAWLTGLILLESGRLEKWRKSKLFAGAFALAWASGVLYYAVAACLGVVVYMIAAVWQRGWRKAMPAVAAMAAGACLFGLPYIFLFLLPNLKLIEDAVRLSQGSGGIPQSLAIHWRIYRGWSRWTMIVPLMRLAMRPGVPLMVYSTAILGTIRLTRVLAFAALPLQAFIYFFASHKHEDYFVHEVAFFGLALSMGALVVGGKLASQIPKAAVGKAFLPVAAGLLCLYLAIGNKTLETSKISLKPHLHEADVARAAAREILGPDPIVASPLAWWYASGAAYWFRLEGPWPIWRPADVIPFLECFEATAVGEFGSTYTGRTPQESITFQYANGSLKLRGFFFGHTDLELQFVLLHPHPTAPVVGYAAEGERLFRFDERADGDHEVVSALCPDMFVTGSWNWGDRWTGSPSAVVYLPQPRPDGAASVVTVLMARNAPEPAGEIGRSCHVLSRYRGAIHEVDKYALVDELRRTDVPIQFYRSPREIPGCIAHINSAPH